MRLARSQRLGNSRQAFLNFLGIADADLVPVEKLVLEARQGLVGMFASRVFMTYPINDRFQNRKSRRVAVGLGLIAALEHCMNV